MESWFKSSLSHPIPSGCTASRRIQRKKKAEEVLVWLEVMSKRLSRFLEDLIDMRENGTRLVAETLGELTSMLKNLTCRPLQDGGPGVLYVTSLGCSGNIHHF
jgi:hypothetical protein